MKNIIKFLLCLLLASTVTKTEAQLGVLPAPYCMPVFGMIPCNQPWASNNPGNFINDFINDFNTTGGTTNIINNGSMCNSQTFPVPNNQQNYFFFGCQYYLQTVPGQVITCNIRSGITYAHGFAVFVDWNQDNIFNLTNERVVTTPVPPAFTWTGGTFTVPGATPPGVYRMRVRSAYVTPGTGIDPCTYETYGEAEDYNVYVSLPPPNQMTVTLTSNSPVCIGQVININTTVTGGPGNPMTYTYTWAGPNTFTSNVMNPSFTATSVAQSGIYTLTVKPGTGCNATNTIQIWVNPNPSTSITNNGPVCQGSNIVFNNTVAGSGVMSYQWNGPNGYTNNIVSPVIAAAQPSNTGIYNFTVVSTFTNGGVCSATSNSSVAIVPVANVTVTPTYTLCQGSNLNLTPNVVGATSYSWTGPNTFTSNLQNPSVNNVMPINSGNYNFTAVFTSTSTTLTCNSTAVVNLSVVAMSPVTPFATANVCQGGTATFSASAVGSNPTYSWMGPNGYVSTNQVNSITNILPISSGNYSVNAIFSIGTVSCITSNVIPISVVPVNPITVIPQVTVCNGDGTSFGATSPGAISYTWSGPSGFNVVNPSLTFINLTPTSSGVYTVTTAYTNGALTCYNTNSTVLTVKPNIQFSLSPIGKLCYNDNIIINGPVGATSYTWTGPNGFNVNSQNVNLPNAALNNIGTYSVVVDLNGCKTYGSVFVDVNTPINWKNLISNKTICRGDNVTFVAEAGNGTGNYAYNWNPSTYLTGPTGSVQTGVAYGTTIYNVSVYDIACPMYTISQAFTLTVNQPPTPNLSLINNQCEPFCSVYNSKIMNQSQTVAYTFNGGNTYFGDSINICLNAGQYTLDISATGLNGCTGVTRYPNTIVVYPKPNADFTWNPSNPNTISESFVTFTPVNQTTTISAWLWDFSGHSTSSDKTPSYQFDRQDNYAITLVLTTDHGCMDTITKVVQVRDEFLLFVPNAFTPNGDGLNDVFCAKGLGIKSFEMAVYDRWGNQIFQSGDINKAWDGTFKSALCPDDSYVYKISIVDGSGKAHTKTGHVTLMK